MKRKHDDFYTLAGFVLIVLGAFRFDEPIYSRGRVWVDIGAYNQYLGIAMMLCGGYLLYYVWRKK